MAHDLDRRLAPGTWRPGLRVRGSDEVTPAPAERTRRRSKPPRTDRPTLSLLRKLTNQLTTTHHHQQNYLNMSTISQSVSHSLPSVHSGGRLKDVTLTVSLLLFLPPQLATSPTHLITRQLQSQPASPTSLSLHLAFPSSSGTRPTPATATSATRPRPSGLLPPASRRERRTRTTSRTPRTSAQSPTPLPLRRRPTRRRRSVRRRPPTPTRPTPPAPTATSPPGEPRLTRSSRRRRSRSSRTRDALKQTC